MFKATHNECVAIIPARGGSKGLPGKNLRLLGGIPLLGRCINAALKSVSIQAVYVSTNDSDIATVAKQYGADVIMRPSELSTDTACSEEALLHGLEYISKLTSLPSILVFLQCTSPFTTSQAIDKVVTALDDPACDMAFSTTEDNGFFWNLDQRGLGVGVNHDHTQPRKRRQDLPKQLRETGAIYAMRVTSFQIARNRFCGHVKPVEVDLPMLEIDSLEDFQIAEALLKYKS